MFIHRFYTESIAQASYYIESDGMAVIIDPFRNPQPYIDMASERNAVIKYIFETHCHSDFIGGHVDLAKESGAIIVFGPGAVTDYPVHCAKDKEELALGTISFRVLHTPGHTPESCCFLLLDEKQMPHSVFTGDTLLVDDVGRPDLFTADEHSVDIMAGELYDSLHQKLISLPNYVVVYPGHGMGSFCAKNIGTDSFTTIGLQKQKNYALQANSKSDFVFKITEGLTKPPKYFYRDFIANKSILAPFYDLMEMNCNPIHFRELIKLCSDKSILVLDTRHYVDFSNGYIPNSINIGFEGLFALNVALLYDLKTKIVVVSDKVDSIEIIKLLTGIGFENILGFLEGGFDKIKQSGEHLSVVENISASEFASDFNYNADIVVDVRTMDECIPGIVAGAKLIPLDELESNLNELNRNKKCYVYCSSGYRSVTAYSILKKYGFNKVFNILGGMESLSKTNIPIKQLSLIHS